MVNNSAKTGTSLDCLHMCLWRDKNTQIYSMLKTVCDKTVDFLCALKNLNVLFLYLLFFSYSCVKGSPQSFRNFCDILLSFFFFFFLNRCCCMFCIPLCILVILSVQTVKDNTNLLHVTNFFKGHCGLSISIYQITLIKWLTPQTKNVRWLTHRTISVDWINFYCRLTCRLFSWSECLLFAL